MPDQRLPEPMENGNYPAYAWPGGYPMYYLCKDGGVLCPKCLNDNKALINDPDEPEWYVLASDINYEDPDLYCDNCSERIESAYAEERAEG
jgi:hypothetical protein